MYKVFQQHRLIKILAGVVILLALGYGLRTYNRIKTGVNATSEGVIGYYSYKSNRVEILKDSGYMVSGDTLINFHWLLEYGEITCSDIDSDKTWKMHVVDSINLFNDFDHTYLFRKELASETSASTN
jgi:hypothetical protein